MPSQFDSSVLPAVTGLDLGSPSQRWDLFANSIDLNGNVSFPGRLVNVAFTATPVFDLLLGNIHKMTLTGNVSSASLNNGSAGNFVTFIITQDAIGSRTFVWPANVKGAMAIDGTANAVSVQSFVHDGSNAYAVSPGAVIL